MISQAAIHGSELHLVLALAAVLAVVAIAFGTSYIRTSNANGRKAADR